MSSWGKTLLQRLGCHDYVKRKYDYVTLPKGSTVFVHIGKCGGRTVKQGLNQTNQYSDLYSVHAQKPFYRKDLKYIILARNPITRLKSAFRWRYKIVVANGNQRERFDDEFNVLSSYGTLNQLAEALYSDGGSSNHQAQHDIRRIHHIREDIAFYLEDLLKKCSLQQISAVLMQENLDTDIERVFGFRNQLREHSNPKSRNDEMLTALALRNLRKFFVKDFEALTKLYCWGKIDREVYLNAI
jgi:hypothetical protein